MRPTLEQAEEFAFKQFDAPSSVTLNYHYGKVQLNELLEFIYGEKPKKIGVRGAQEEA